MEFYFNIKVGISLVKTTDIKPTVEVLSFLAIFFHNNYHLYLALVQLSW